MCTIWQCFGRGTWNPSLTAIAILFVEPKHFDEEKRKWADSKAHRDELAQIKLTRKGTDSLLMEKAAKKHHQTAAAGVSQETSIEEGEFAVDDRGTGNRQEAAGNWTRDRWLAVEETTVSM